MKLKINKYFKCYIGTDLREYFPGDKTSVKTENGIRKTTGIIEKPEMEEIETLVDRYKVAVPVVEDEKIEHQEEIDVEKRIAELKDGLEKKRFKGVAIKKAKEELEKLMEKVK